MTEYRQLSEQELKLMGINLGCPTKLKTWVKKYYHTSANKILVILNLEYNDSSYDYRGCTILVFDNDGNELIPAKGNSIEARIAINNFYASDFGLSDEIYDLPEQSQLIYYLNTPELFVKVS